MEQQNVFTQQPQSAADMPVPVNQGYYPGMPQQPPQPAVTTVVINNQSTASARGGKQGWDTDLCGCMEDCLICWLVMLCPQCYLCHLSNKMGEGCYMPMCVPTPIAVMGLRTTVRVENNIRGSVFNDFCLTHICCTVQCAICQVARQFNITPSKNN